MSKNKFKLITCIALVIFFSISVVSKMFENDTYFALAVGNKILDVGFYTEEDFTFVDGLEYENVRWIFDVIMANIYNNFDYLGIYVFVMIVTAIIGLSIYYILLKQKCPMIISLLLTLVTISCAHNVFVARAQILSFLIFIWEYYFIEKILETKQKRYTICLFVLSVLLANTHASVYPLYFVIFLPFIAEEILSKISFLPKKDSKIIIENKSALKILLITFVVTCFGGLITPLGLAPYINIFKTVGEVSSDFISEMAPIVPALNPEGTYFLIIFAGIIGFSKTKVKLSDCLVLFGFALLSFSNIRSVYFLLFLGSFAIGNVLTNFYNEYKLGEIKLENNRIYNGFLIIGSLIIVIISVNNLFANLSLDYEDPELCPHGVVDYIWANFEKDEIDEMRIYNGFNFGSYMEFRGLPVFMDSRAEIYLSRFNNTTIIEDFLKLSTGEVHYDDIFEKYDINYALIENSSVVANYIYEDRYWNLLYQDNYFSFYEKVTE